MAPSNIIYLSISLSLSIYLSMYLSIYVSIYLSTPFARAFPLPSCSRDCSPAPDSMFWKLILPHAFVSGGVFFRRHRPQIKIHQRGVQWKQGVVICMMLHTSLLYDTTPIQCTPLPLHPPVMNPRQSLPGHERSRERSPKRFGIYSRKYQFESWIYTPYEYGTRILNSNSNHVYARI